jgi:hypothetical protein
MLRFSSSGSRRIVGVYVFAWPVAATAQVAHHGSGMPVIDWARLRRCPNADSGCRFRRARREALKVRHQRRTNSRASASIAFPEAPVTRHIEQHVVDVLQRRRIDHLSTGSRPGVFGLYFEFARYLHQPFADFEIRCSSGKSVTALRVLEKMVSHFA